MSNCSHRCVSSFFFILHLKLKSFCCSATHSSLIILLFLRLPLTDGTVKQMLGLSLHVLLNYFYPSKDVRESSSQNMRP